MLIYALATTTAVEKILTPIALVERFGFHSNDFTLNPLDS